VENNGNAIACEISRLIVFVHILLPYLDFVLACILLSKLWCVFIWLREILGTTNVIKIRCRKMALSRLVGWSLTSLFSSNTYGYIRDEWHCVNQKYNNFFMFVNSIWTGTIRNWSTYSDWNGNWNRSKNNWQRECELLDWMEGYE